MQANPKGRGPFTSDAIYEGRLVVRQSLRGYRFSVDAYLLIWFACQGRTAALCADLGAGSGVVGLGLLAAGVARRVVAFEAQPELARLAEENASCNGLSDRYQLLALDVEELPRRFPSGAFDLIVANPPFWPVSKGRLPGNLERRIACHEVLGGIDRWTAAASAALDQRRGRLCMVYPARRLDSLILALGDAGLSATRLRLVHPISDGPAELVLLEARRGKPGRLEVEPPVVLKESDGAETPLASAIVRGSFSDRIRALPDRR